MAARISEQFCDCLFDQRVIHQDERNILRNIQLDLPSIEGFSFDFNRRLQQLAHIAPFSVRLDYAALESIHIQQIIYNSVESVGAVMNLASELLEHLGIGSSWFESQQFLTGGTDCSEGCL